MRREHLVDGWWQMPGEPVPSLGWPGTKNGDSHRIWLPAPVRDIIGSGATGFVFPGQHGKPVTGLDDAMRKICVRLGVTDKATPHDLRRTFSSTVTGLGFGRPAMHRLTNHRQGDDIGDIYDRNDYSAREPARRGGGVGFSHPRARRRSRRRRQRRCGELSASVRNLNKK